MYKKIVAALFVATASLVAGEPSAFGAGNLDSSSPYGLTSSEKTVFQNKTNLKKIVVKSNNQANKVESLRERIDGLQSIIESLSRKAQSNKRSLTNLENKNNETLKTSDEYDRRVGEIAEENSELIAENKILLEKFSKLLTSVNKTYVSKSQFNKLVEDVNEFKALISKELKGSSTQVKINSLDSMSDFDVASKAQAFYDKRYFTKGIEYYSHLIRKNYKPAHAHYMIGQMNFKRKKYGQAISYYKLSASLYSKAPYMAELMLNTGISMDKTNDKKNAKAFYNGVVGKFPGTSQAKNAQKYLKSL